MDSSVVPVVDTDEIKAELVIKMLSDLRRIPVVDIEQRIVGTLNRVDIVQALFEGMLNIA
jgi:predicted transcriptional regulator